MKYQPTLLDIASDLKRCIFASYSEEKFLDDNFLTFFQHASKLLKKLQQNLDHKTAQVVRKCLRRASKENLSPNKRREDLLTAAILLQDEAVSRSAV